jgi:hypothetical protein
MESHVNKAKCEVIGLQKQLEQLNAIVQSLECGSEFINQQVALSSQSPTMERFQ